MTRAFWAGLAVCAIGVGCRGPHYYPDPFAHVAPPAFSADGTRYAVEDRRPDWEKKPFTGAVTLYHLNKVRPGPFEQLTAEAKTAVASMPEKPASVTIAVSSCRLVKLDEARLKGELPTHTFTLVPGVSWANELLAPEDLYPKGVVEHPDGATCSLEATVTLEFVGKPAKTFALKTIAGDPGFTDSGYTGEVMEAPVRGAVFQFGRQFRSAAGLPADG
jgi:hypothetical protein